MPCRFEAEQRRFPVGRKGPRLTAAALTRIFHAPHEVPTGRSAGFSLQVSSRLLLQAKACAPPGVCEICGAKLPPAGVWTLPALLNPERMRSLSPRLRAMRYVGLSPLLGNREHGVSPPKGVLDALLCVRIRQPLAVHDKKVFMPTGPEGELTFPPAIAQRS